MNKFDRLVVVTGATRGLGLAIVKRLFDDGYTVLAVGRTLSDGLKLVMSEGGDRVFFEEFDLERVDKIHEFSKSIIGKYGRPYGLINNAAIGGDGVLATMHENDIDKIIKVNIQAPILLTKYLVRSMMLNQRGRVINISSIVASTGFSGLAVYGASKAALSGFTKSLSREVGKLGITVNTVAPGYMETSMTEGLQGDKLKMIKRRSPLGELACVEDVASSVSYLLSSEAGKILGTTLTVDAGSTA